MNFLSSFWGAAKRYWGYFHNFCASIAPGFKTFVLSAVGVLGSVGASLQEYLTGVPIEKFVTAQEVLYINMALFTAVFIARHLTNVAASNAVSTS